MGNCRRSRHPDCTTNWMSRRLSCGTTLKSVGNPSGDRISSPPKHPQKEAGSRSQEASPFWPTCLYSEKAVREAPTKGRIADRSASAFCLLPCAAGCCLLSLVGPNTVALPCLLRLLGCCVVAVLELGAICVFAHLSSKRIIGKPNHK